MLASLNENTRFEDSLRFKWKDLGIFTKGWGIRQTFGHCEIQISAAEEVKDVPFEELASGDEYVRVKVTRAGKGPGDLRRDHR